MALDMPIEAETRLRRWRRSRGLKLQEVADLVGLSEPYLSRLEMGVKVATPTTRVKIARRLGVRIADVFDVAPVGVGAPD